MNRILPIIAACALISGCEDISTKNRLIQHIRTECHDTMSYTIDRTETKSGSVTRISVTCQTETKRGHHG